MRLQKSIVRQLRFTISEILLLIAFLPLSIGLVQVAVLCSAGALDLLGPQRVVRLSRSIASALGGLSDVNRVVFVLGGMKGVLVALFLSVALSLLLCLRPHGFKGMCISLIVAVPFLSMLHMVWFPGFQFDFNSISVLWVHLVVPLMVALALCLYCLIVTSRLKAEAKKSTAQETTSRRWLCRFALVVSYCLACAYGWNDIRNSRSKALDEIKLWNDRMREHRIQVITKGPEVP